MRKPLQIAGLILALVSIFGWGVTGANRGWTKTSVERRTLDEVTGQEAIRYEKAFKPGVDLLAPALLLAIALAGVAFLFPKRK
jgi:hypothetical protein